MEKSCKSCYTHLHNQLYLLVVIYEWRCQNSYAKMFCTIVLSCIGGGKWNHCSFVNFNSMSFYCNPLKYKWCNLSFLSVGFKRTFQSMLLTEMAAPKWAENFFLLWSFSCFDLHKRKSFLKQAICYGPLKWHSVALRKSEAFVELLYQ